MNDERRSLKESQHGNSGRCNDRQKDQQFLRGHLPRHQIGHGHDEPP